MTNNLKISAPKRKFFLKWLPFNFCDRFCERCEEFRDQPDSMISGALGFYSLVVCQKNLESILSLIKDVEKSWAPRINKLLKTIIQTKKEFKTTFPRIESFKDKIIFHGKL